MDKDGKNNNKNRNIKGITKKAKHPTELQKLFDVSGYCPARELCGCTCEASVSTL